MPEWTTLKRMIWLLLLRGASAVIRTVTGTAPLTLSNAVSRAIKSLTQYGLCTQSTTPTPDAPVDIVCNNGTVKLLRRSGLPLGYKKLSYIESTGTQYINTGFAIPDLTNDYEVDYKITISGGTGQGTSSNNWGYMGQNSLLMLALTGTNGVGGASAGVPWITDHIYEVSHHRGSDASRSLTVDGTLFEHTNQTTIYADREFGIFALSPFTTNFNRIYGKLYEFKAYKNGELVMSLVPCQRLSDNAIGVYDIVNDTFIGNAGTDAFIAGADDDETYLDVVGTPETLTVSADGAEAQTVTDIPMLLSVGDFKDEAEIISGVVTRKCGIMVLDGTEEIWGTATQTPDKVTVLTNCYTVAIPLGNAPIDKRRVYCTHLNSSDALPAADKRQGYALLGNGGTGTPAPLSNKYALGLGLTTRFPTIAGLKQWLAEQYAAGTPVIVIYPLAEETTEQTAPHALRTAKGTNVVDVVSNVDPVELEVEYSASA